MADISRIASPMSRCEEDLFDVDKLVEKKKKELTELQNTPASFFIGSVDIVNKRIANLSNQLLVFDSKLAIESRSSYGDDIQSLAKRRSPWHATRSARARDERDAQVVEGALSSDTVFSSGDKTFRKRMPLKKSDEPQLVELQQYPGYDARAVTPLPHSLETTAILDWVTAAQVDLKRKPFYKKDFVKIFYSKAQRAILQDAFWWFFLNRFHPNAEIQAKLFKRIAKKYVVVFLMDINQRHKNVFLSNYGNLLAQSIYATFCHAFPQSWRQFDDFAFKELLLSTCITWVDGIKPRPGLYNQWNYSALEPAGMRKDESISNDSTDTEDLIGSGRFSRISKVMSSTSRESFSKSKSESKPTTKSSTIRADALSTVSSFKSKSNDVVDKVSESCPAGRAVEFEKCAFNLHGGSPLLHEYFQEKKFTPNSGADHLVKRTQIQSYPPPEAQTFDDVVKEAAADVRQISTEFRRLNNALSKNSLLFLRKQKLEENEHQEKTRKMLAKPRQVRRLSTMILMDLKRNKEDSTSKSIDVVGALQDALSSQKLDSKAILTSSNNQIA